MRIFIPWDKDALRFLRVYGVRNIEFRNVLPQDIPSKIAAFIDEHKDKNEKFYCVNPYIIDYLPAEDLYTLDGNLRMRCFADEFSDKLPYFYAGEVYVHECC